MEFSLVCPVRAHVPPAPVTLTAPAAPTFFLPCSPLRPRMLAQIRISRTLAMPGELLRALRPCTARSGLRILPLVRRLMSNSRLFQRTTTPRVTTSRARAPTSKVPTVARAMTGTARTRTTVSRRNGLRKHDPLPSVTCQWQRTFL